MLLKTKDVDELKLKKKAKAVIKNYARPNDKICYIPYLDVMVARIKFIKFILVRKRWVIAE